MRPLRASVGAMVVAVLIAAPVRAQNKTVASSDARSVSAEALRAVEADTAIRTISRWTSRLARNSNDRAAELGLARIAWLRNDTASGTRWLDRLSTGAPADEYTVYARLGHAISLDARASFVKAGEEYIEALKEARQLHDSAAAGAILTNFSHVRYQTGGSAAGLVTLDTARGLISPIDTITLALYHGRRAGYLMQSRNGGAETEALTCIALAKQARIQRTQGLCLSLLGIEMYQRGNVDSAVALMRVAIGAYGRGHDFGARGDALVSIGRMLIVIGDYGAARDAVYQSVGDLRAAKQSPAWALFTLAEIARTIHDPAAAQLAALSADRFETDGELPGAIAARDVQARLALDIGDVKHARELLGQNLAQARMLKLPINEFDAHEVLSNVAASVHDWTTAQSELDSVRTLAAKSQMTGWKGTLDYDYGMLAFHRGDLATAEKYFDAYLRPLHASEGILRYRGHARLAGVYAARGELARAQKELASAGAALDQWRASLADPDLRVLAFQSTDDLDPDLGVPKVLALLATHGFADATLQMAERRRARALTDLLVRAEALRTKRASGHGGARLAPAAEAGARSALDARTALLEYVTGADGAPTTLFVETRTGPARAYLLAPADSLETGIARLAALLGSGTDAPALERTLGSALLDSAVADLPVAVNRLIVVPDGPLHRVPFDALRLHDGRYAVERYAISTSPSAAVVTSLRGRLSSADAVTTARILVFGDVAFSNERLAQSPASRGGAFAFAAMRRPAAHLERLPGSEVEANHVARYSREAVVRLRENASEDYLKHTNLEQFGVIHFATHAIVDDASITATALELAPGRGESGFVSPGDLGALHLRADLVVLSACSTAGGVTVTGEGVQGLTAALLQAGARSVVATQWRIGDRSTVDFVDAFYAALARKLPVSDALRAAKLDAIRRGAPPSEWAAFTVIGDPAVVVPLTVPTSRARIALAIGAALLIAATIAYLLLMRSRRSAELASPRVVRARTHQE